MRSHHHLVHLVDDALSTHNLQPFCISLQRIEGLVVDKEVQLRSKPHATHHPQRVVIERHIRVQRRTDNAVEEVVDTAERVYQLTEPVFVQAYSQGIDGEVATVLVVFQRTVFHMWLTRVVTIALSPCTHKLHLYLFCLYPARCSLFISVNCPVSCANSAAPSSPYFHLCRPEALKHAQVCLSAVSLLQFLSHGDAAPDDHHVDILRRPFQKQISDIAANDVAFHPQLVCHRRYLVEDLLV